MNALVSIQVFEQNLTIIFLTIPHQMHHFKMYEYTYVSILRNWVLILIFPCIPKPIYGFFFQTI